MRTTGGRRRPAQVPQRTDLLNPVQMIVGSTDPHGPCHVCELPLTALGPNGEKSTLVFVAVMSDPNDDNSWFMLPLHQWCAPRMKGGKVDLR